MEDVPIGEAQQNLARLIGEIARSGARFAITRDGQPVAVLLGAEEYDSVVETLDVLGDEALVAAISDALVSTRAGEVFSHEDVAHDVAARRP
jgi:prevent-host-death family protein